MALTHATIPGAIIFNDDAPLGLNNRCPAIIPISKNVRGRIHIEPQRGRDCPCKCEYPRLPDTIVTYSLAYKIRVADVHKYRL